MATVKYGFKKALFLIRGPSGAGKSTLAKALMDGDESLCFENDKFWGTAYDKFDPSIHAIAIDWCVGEVAKKLVVDDVEAVAVANTFTKMTYIEPYIKFCKAHEIVLVIGRATTELTWQQCWKRNVHKLTYPIAKSIAESYEEFPEERIAELRESNIFVVS